MAITRLRQMGAEWRTLPIEFSSASGNSTSTTNPKSGTTRGLISVVAWTHSATLTQCRAAYHFMHAALTADAAKGDIFNLRSGASTVIVRVTYQASTGLWSIICGTATVATATDRAARVYDTYFHVAVDVKIDASAGWVYVYCDGRLVVSFDGDTNEGGANFDTLRLNAVGADGTWQSATYSVDDLYWDDTSGEGAPAAPPDLRFDWLNPNGNGNYSQFVGSDGNSTDNYLLVDEVGSVPADTDYVTTATDALKDSYALTTITVPSGWNILAVIFQVAARKTDVAGTMGLKLGGRYSAVDAVGAKKDLTTAYLLYEERMTTQPGGGAWSQAAVDGVEALIESNT